MSSPINARSGHQFFVRGLVVALVAATLAGCSLWSADKSKPVPADLGANVAVLGVRQAWTARLGNVAGLPLEVHVAGNVVTVASADGAVAALDARTGGDIWRAALAEPLSAAVGSDGKFAAVVSRNNALIVIDGGRERWRETLAAQVFTPPRLQAVVFSCCQQIDPCLPMICRQVAVSGPSSAPGSL
jgi:outer membrane protein assembly factor BamB